MGYTGRVIYQTLIQYDVATGQPTGVVKPNTSGDPDYIAPFIDETACPTGTISLSNNFLYFNFEGGSQFIDVISDGAWEVTPQLGFNVVPSTGLSGTTTVEIEVLPTNNGFDSEFSTTFKLTNTNISDLLTVYQEGNKTGQV